MALKTFLIKTKREVISDADGHWIVAMGFRKSSMFDEVLLTLWEQLPDIIAFEMFCHRQHVQLCITADEMNMDAIKSAVYVMIPEAEFIDIPDPVSLVNENDLVATNEYTVVEQDILPFKTFDDQKHDCIAPLLNVMTMLPPHLKVYVQYVAKPIPDDWKQQLKSKLQIWSWIAQFPFRPTYWVRPKVFERLKGAYDKSQLQLFNINLRTAVVGSLPENPDKLEEREQEILDAIKCVFHSLRYTHFTHMGALRVKKQSAGIEALDPLITRQLKKPFFVSRKELATFWHPIAINLIPSTTETIAKKIVPPPQLSTRSNPADTSYFARTEYRNTDQLFGINREDRKKHLHILGKSGVGKSKLIQLLAKSDIENGFGLALLDCHGDLVDELLTAIPQQRVKDVVLIDISDENFCPSFNPFSHTESENKKYLVSELIETIERVENFDIPEAVEQVLTYALLAIMEAPRTSFISLLELIVNEEYRNQLIASLPKGTTKTYWQTENDERDEMLQSDGMRAVIRVLCHLLSSDLISSILGQDENRFDFTQMMKEQKIILIKIPKKNVGKKASVLFGSIVLALLNFAANARKNTALRDFYIYIDEFQNFSSASITKAIAEGEKNKISYTIAHQMIKQLPKDIHDTLSSKIQNLISFQVGGDDSELLAARLAPAEGDDILNLDARSFYVKKTLASEQLETFSGKTIDMEYLENDFRKEIVEYTRRQYCRPLEEVKPTIIDLLKINNSLKAAGF